MRRIAGLVGMLLVVACSGPPAVPPVPSVPDAREIVGADPCALAPPESLAAAGVVGPGTRADGTEGPGCTWRAADRAPQALTVSVFPGDLGTLARGSDPTTTRVRLAGRPALETFTGTGEFCQYDVAVADDQVLQLGMEGGRPDSCTALQALAPALLDRLPRP